MPNPLDACRRLVLLTAALLAALPLAAAAQAPGRQVIIPLRAWGETAEVAVWPTLQFGVEGERVRVNLEFDSDMTELRDLLVRETDRQWLTAACAGDDFGTSEVDVAPMDETIRLTFIARFVRWTSASDCAQGREAAIEAAGPAAVDIGIAADDGPPRLVGTVARFEPTLAGGGGDAGLARALVREELDAVLQATLDRLNATFRYGAALSEARPEVRRMRFYARDGGGLGLEAETTALLTPEQLNRLMGALTPAR